MKCAVFIFTGDTHLGGSSREGSFKETITLKWCTPRTNNIGRCLKRILKCFKGLINLLMFEYLFYSFKKQVFFSYGNISLYFFKSVFSSISELHYCTGAYRISPVDVNSRPSSCLTNFLLNGNFHHLIVLTEIVTSEIISENMWKCKIWKSNFFQHSLTILFCKLF